MILSAKRNAKTSFELLDENGDPVAHVTTTSDGERLEDIIRAVNLYDYHERLVEALREALEFADDHPGMPLTGHIHAILQELEGEL